MFSKISRFDQRQRFSTYTFCFISRKSKPEAICLPTTMSVLHSHCGDRTPTSSLKGNLQRDIVFAPSRGDRCFISSTSTCQLICKGLPTLCSQLWKQLQCHLRQHSFHSPDLTEDHIQEQEKQTTLITSLQTFPGQIASDKSSLRSM